MKNEREDISRCMELLHEGIPDDDEALLDELIGLVDEALICGGDFSPFDDIVLPSILFPQAARPQPAKKQKALSLLGNFLFFVAIIVITLAAVSHNMGGNGARNLAGYSMFRVLSESMQPEIPKGSLVLTKQVNQSTIQIGDDITYMVGENTSVTHRVVGIIENYENSGERGYETKGVDNEKPDSEVVWARNVVGKVVFHAPYVGTAMVAVSENWLLILLPFIGILVFASLLKYVFSNEAKEKKRKQPKGQPIPSYATVV